MMATATLSSAETVKLFERYVVPNYGRFPVCLVRGEGSYIWDAEGQRYLDFFPGWGCNLLGHCPEPIVRAVQEQVATLIHVPNTWYTEQQGQWARLLSERSFGGQAVFCNSGAEANEGAIKLARLHSKKPRYKIITFTGGFHGRTLGATTATATRSIATSAMAQVQNTCELSWSSHSTAESSIEGLEARDDSRQGFGGVAS